MVTCSDPFLCVIGKCIAGFVEPYILIRPPLP
jgi:hypothetical protein